MTISKRGPVNGDTASTQRFRVADLKDVTMPMGSLHHLALLFFLNRHADYRACLVVFGEMHEHQKAGGHQ